MTASSQSLSLPPLSLLEEFLLLALDDRTQELDALDSGTLDIATAGAILMDLTLRNRIDNDLRDMFTSDAAPTGDDILDPALQMIALAPVLTPHPIAYWLRQIADDAQAIREKALARLEKRGIVQRRNKRVFWILGKRRYPLMDQQEVREVRERILSIVLGDEVPSPRDIMLTSLAEACGLFHKILGKNQRDIAGVRIRQVSRLDLIGQAVAKSVSDIHNVLAEASGF